jgi:hypothetical protein
MACCLEGARGVFVVGGHEHQLRHRRLVGGPAVGQLGGGAQAVEAGHADVEEQHLRQQAQRLAHGAAAVAGGGDDLQFGPGGGQLGLQGLGQQRLVFGDECGAGW